DEIVEAAIVARVATAVVSERLFRQVADTDTPQGVILIAKRPVAALTDLECRVGSTVLPVVVFLSEINNPSSLGAVIRAAEAAGAAGVITSPGSADAFSPKALRSSMGSAFRLPVVEKVSLNEACSWAHEKGLVTTGTTADAETSYVNVAWNKPRMVVFGSEAHGLSGEELEMVDETIRIPMSAPVESLNLSVSAGVILFEARRQVHELER